MSGIRTNAVLEAIVIPSNAPRSELTGWNMSGTIFTSRRTWPRRRKMAVVTSASSQKGILFPSPAAFFLEVHLDPVTTFSVQFTRLRNVDLTGAFWLPEARSVSEAHSPSPPIKKSYPANTRYPIQVPARAALASRPVESHPARCPTFAVMLTYIEHPS